VGVRDEGRDRGWEMGGRDSMRNRGRDVRREEGGLGGLCT